MEAGYQIGCGIAQDDIESIISAGIHAGRRDFRSPPAAFLPDYLNPSLSYQMKIDLKPGTVNIVPVDKKTFKGTSSDDQHHWSTRQVRPVRRVLVHPVVRDADQLDR